MRKYFSILSVVFITIVFSGHVYGENAWDYGLSEDYKEAMRSTPLYNCNLNADLQDSKNTKLQILNESVKNTQKERDCYNKADSVKSYLACLPAGKKPVIRDEEKFQSMKQGTLRSVDRHSIATQRAIACVHAAADVRMVCSCDFLTRTLPATDLPMTETGR